MFDNLTERLSHICGACRLVKLTEENIRIPCAKIAALLKRIALPVVKAFVDQARTRSGSEVSQPSRSGIRQDIKAELEAVAEGLIWP
jgi:hypothetical protein